MIIYTSLKTQRKILGPKTLKFYLQIIDILMAIHLTDIIQLKKVFQVQILNVCK